VNLARPSDALKLWSADSKTRSPKNLMARGEAG
jgi:hypothetical protein